jgi:hypothetical protein
MPKSHHIGRRPSKSYQNTPNDNPQHTQIRRGSIWLSTTGYTQKTRTPTQQRVKISSRTIRDVSNGECSLRGGSTNPIRNAGTKQRKNNKSIRPFCVEPRRMNIHKNLQHINPYLYGRRIRLETYK